MSFKQVLVGYVSSLIVFLLLDIGWITKVVSPLYKSQLGAMVLDKPLPVPAVLFYLLYLVGLVYFAVAPGVRSQVWSVALINGALYGFFCYITFALTNLSVLRGWTLTVAASDIGWGVFVSAVTACAAALIVGRVSA